MDVSILYRRTQRLVERLVKGCQRHSLGSATVAIYDTAWVSMIFKRTDGEHRWLFPESFRFLLDNQLPHGGWISYASVGDGILNTMAALLALRRHKQVLDFEGKEDLDELETRISRAKSYLQDILQAWDVESEIRVGFEILVPALLAMLEAEGISFAFPGRDSLHALYQTKMSNFDPQILYGTTKTTLLHSLEALVGRIDFDRIRHHKTFGGMMGSPASTAAYLLHSSTWDDEAELYIRRVLSEGAGEDNGGVPSVFPIPIFEITWVVSTLLEGGFSENDLGTYSLNEITSYIVKTLESQQGLVGFSPEVLADADDTARSILTLNLLEKPFRLDRMLSHFKSDNGHLRTYLGERDASFSANCNVLKAILHSPDVDNYQNEVERITSFLCESWWNGAVKDKWNISPHYSMLLLAEALVRLLQLCDEGRMRILPEAIMRHRIPIVLAQILNRTLLTQTSNGGWISAESPEVTAYAVLTLVAISTLPWTALLDSEINSAIEAGRTFLRQAQENWTAPQYVWVEKVTYANTVLSEAYCLAAMNVPTSTYSWSDRIKNLVTIPEKRLVRFAKFFSTLETFRDEPLWKLKASMIEGCLFLPQLKSARTDILPRQQGAKNEYLDYIPSTWITISNHKGLFLESNLLWNMMVLTVCNFRVDEYMETTAAKLGQDKWDSVGSTIRTLCAAEESAVTRTRKRPHEESAKLMNDDANSSQVNGIGESSETGTVKAVLAPYVQAMLNYPLVSDASPSDRSQLRLQLQRFLLAHLSQIKDNARFSSQRSRSLGTTEAFLAPSSTFYNWAHTIGAESVSCPFSFAFLTCLLGVLYNRGNDCFSSVYQKYLANDLCSHLSVMSRLYNDYGSIVRDRAEANLNSVNFPEFHEPFSKDSADNEDREHGLKTELLRLAQYERDCVEAAAERFDKDLRQTPGNAQRVADGLLLFTGVAKVYADIYVAKDLSNRVEITNGM